MSHPLSLKKFATLSVLQQHKVAAKCIYNIHCKSTPSLITSYRVIENYFALSPLPSFTFPHLSDRYHIHRQQAHLPYKQLPPLITKNDTLSSTPYLPITIYLDNLRSSHNVGSIVRTTEAFRLGKIHFGGTTPTLENAKVQRVAMGSDKLIHTTKQPLKDLPAPRIALETAKNTTSLFDYTFPDPPFTLMLGNEAYGLSQHALACADAVLPIPLCGNKNSLNVACAFAIVAAFIRRQCPYALSYR